jgi:hypothetical protein
MVQFKDVKYLDTYGWYVSSDEQNDGYFRYLRQDLNVSNRLDADDRVNGGYFDSEEQALLARDEYYRKHLRSDKMDKIGTVNIEDMLKGVLENTVEVENGCNCADIHREDKFLGRVYEHNGDFVETLHESTKSELKRYLKNPANIGRRVLVYKGVSAYSSDVPVTTHDINKKKKNK